ncbi:MAG: response regulator [Spirochaetales bacterium]|nr:response regulator [Spirochaetales bacterium]
MKKILIVDDDPDLRDAIKTVLQNKYEMKEAGSRDEVFQVLKGFQPDLIILDVMMDTTSTGFELSRELRKDEQIKNVRILMLTSVDEVTNIDFKSTAGDAEWLPVNDYLTKPIEPKILISKVEALLS